MLIHVKLETTINVPASIVWKVLAHEFENIDLWSSGINKSTSLDLINVPADAKVGGRLCDTTEEVLTFYDEASMQFSYKMANRPWFIKNISNTWTVNETNSEESVVSIEPEININIFLGLLMKLFMPFLKKLGTDTLEELKYYVENEKPHPRKLKKLEKLKKKK